MSTSKTKQSLRFRHELTRRARAFRTADFIRLTVSLAVLVLVLLANIALLRYRFLHPELTETQLLLHVLDALRWQP